MTIMEPITDDLVIEEDDISSDNISADESSEAEVVAAEISEDEMESDSAPLNSGWADSISKILKSTKPKHKRTLVLSRARKLTEVKIKEKVEEPGFEIDGEIKEETKFTEPIVVSKDVDEPPKKKKKEILTLRVKPDILERDRERVLTKIATRGVVQLFNAVQNQQKSLSQKIQSCGPLERKRDKILKNIDKRSFLDVLMNQKSQEVDIKDETSQKSDDVKSDVKDESTNTQQEPSWNILRDDFMMGAKLKDWDKEDESEGEQEALDESESSS